jgi:O-antigen/teichoic acid export membrane protein
LGIIFCVFLLLTKDSIINVLFGDDYTLSSRIIPYFFPGVLILAIARGTYAFCTKLNSPLPINVIAVTTTLLNIALNLLLIPIYGLIGAAIASTVSYSAMGFSYIFWFLKEKSSLPKLERRIKDA